MKDIDKDSEKPKKFRKRKVIQEIEQIPPTESELININEPIILEIAELADKHGYELYIVGGYVRDLLLGRERKDFDFSIVGDSIEFANLVAKTFNTKAVIYERFRTALVPINNFNCEFVGTRKEVYEASSRNPIVTIGTLEDDLKRRDFTVNALAISLNKYNFGNQIGRAHV